MTDIERWARDFNARVFARMAMERERDREETAWLAKQSDAELKVLSATWWLVNSKARNKQVRENALAKYYAVEGEISDRRNARRLVEDVPDCAPLCIIPILHPTPE